MANIRVSVLNALIKLAVLLKTIWPTRMMSLIKRTQLALLPYHSKPESNWILAQYCQPHFVNVLPIHKFSAVYWQRIFSWPSGYIISNNYWPPRSGKMNEFSYVSNYFRCTTDNFLTANNRSYLSSGMSEKDRLSEINGLSSPNDAAVGRTQNLKNTEQQFLSKDTSIEDVEDLIVFSALGSTEIIEIEESETESISQSDDSPSSDDNGWTSDCEQLCAKLNAQSCQGAPASSRFDRHCSESVSTDSGLETRFFQGVDLMHMTRAVRQFGSPESSSDDEASTNSTGKPQLVKFLPRSWDETDSGISSGNSNPSDSSTCDEDPNLKSEKEPNLSSISIGRLNISIPLTCFSANLADSTKLFTSLDLFDPFSNQSSQESDWESDTESEEAETHYPSRSSRLKLKAASLTPLSPSVSKSSSSPLLSPSDLESMSNKKCICNSDTILKCTFCIDTRKKLQRATHHRTVWFPTACEKLETTHYLDDSEEDSSDSLQSYNKTSLSLSKCSSHSSRKSPWELIARDRLRFQRRIVLTDNKISYVFCPQHRVRVFTERFDPSP